MKSKMKYKWFGWDGFDHNGKLIEFYRQDTPIVMTRGNLAGIWKLPWYIKWNPIWRLKQMKMTKMWGDPYFKKNKNEKSSK